MLKLGEALGAWTPAQGRGPADPVVLLGAAWSDIVGAENARNSHPAAVAAQTLTIVTTSSVWSQQLSYLSEAILTTIRARLPSTQIERVRFRVGKMPAQSSRSGSKRVYRNEGATWSAPPPAENAEDALLRFRASVDAAERAKRTRGWKECPGCTALIAPNSGPFCTSCGIARDVERERLVSRLLFEAPWLGFAGTAKLVEDLRQDEYESIRRRLLSRWWDRLCRARLAGKLSRDDVERLIASSYVILKSELAPERLTPAIVRNVLGDELHDLLY